MESLIQLGGRPSKKTDTLTLVLRRVGDLIRDFPALLGDGDRVMVCISGGKDSYGLLDALIKLQKRAPIQFDLIAVNIDQGWPDYDTNTIAKHLATKDVEYHMVKRDFASVVEEKIKPGGTPCSLCSRLRRGVLYGLASELKCSKIALGHHADDLIETLLLNSFFSGRLASMPPILYSNDKQHTVIRPLAYVPEDLLIRLAREKEYPVVRCGCPTCGLPEQRRQWVKRLLTDLESSHPAIKSTILGSLKHVSPTHLLDSSLHSPE